MPKTPKHARVKLPCTGKTDLAVPKMVMRLRQPNVNEQINTSTREFVMFDGSVVVVVMRLLFRMQCVYFPFHLLAFVCLFSTRINGREKKAVVIWLESLLCDIFFFHSKHLFDVLSGACLVFIRLNSTWASWKRILCRTQVTDKSKNFLIYSQRFIPFGVSLSKSVVVRLIDNILFRFFRFFFLALLGRAKNVAQMLWFMQYVERYDLLELNSSSWMNKIWSAAIVFFLSSPQIQMILWLLFGRCRGRVNENKGARKNTALYHSVPSHSFADLVREVFIIIEWNFVWVAFFEW